jgi:hypothetical protein
VFRFSRDTGIPNSTVSGWFKAKKLPDLQTLLVLVKQMGLSLDWLATGQGYMLTTGSFASPQEAAWEWIRAELRAGENLADSEFDAVWKSLGGKEGSASGVTGPLNVALEAVRAVFRTEARRLRLQRLLQEFRSSGRSREGREGRERLADRVWALLSESNESSRPLRS